MLGKYIYLFICSNNYIASNVWLVANDMERVSVAVTPQISVWEVLDSNHDRDDIYCGNCLGFPQYFQEVL
jgi:hypothetical protein